MRFKCIGHKRGNIKSDNTYKNNNSLTATQIGAVTTMREMALLYHAGLPITRDNLGALSASAFNEGSENPSLDPLNTRDMDLNTAWNMQKEATDRIGEVKRRCKNVTKKVGGEPVVIAPQTE